MSFFGSVGKAIAGAFGFGAARPTPNTKPNGGDGVQAYGGYLASGEQNPKLIGHRKWVTYANALNMGIVATGVRYSCDLLAGAKWIAKENERGGTDAKRGVEIVEQGLFGAQMSTSWSSAVSKQSLHRAFGFALHEWVVKRRDDGMIVFADLQHRPQHTVDRWNKPSEQMPWDAIGQLSSSGNSYIVPRNRLWYSVDNTLTDSPDGIGLLRHIVQLSEQLNVLEAIEGFAFETDLRGTPVGRAPLRELRQAAEAKFGEDEAKIRAYLDERTAPMRVFLQNIIKSPENLQYLFFDSSTYQGVDQNTISQVQRWAVELLRGDARGLPELDNTIRRKQLEIARLMGIEFVMMGGNSTGSFAQHADKTSLFAQSLQTSLSRVATDATRDLARPLVALNGLDPDTCTPTLMAEPISMDAVLSVCQALAALATAAFPPGSPQRNAILERLHLPPEEAPPPELTGMLGLGRRGARPGPPDPTRGEVDIPVEDLAVPAGRRRAASSARRPS